MTGPPPIQIPYLRPDPIHEVGFDSGQQEGQLAHLLMLKGHLALEQEKFQAEEGARKEKKQTLAGLSQTLSQLFSGAQTPQDILTATSGAIGPLAGAGETAAAGASIRDLPGLANQVQRSNTQQALGTIMQELQGKDLRDPRVQASALAQIGTVDQEAAKNFAESLRALQGRYTFHQDGIGQWWIGDTERGTMSKGALGAPSKGANMPITTEEARTTAQIGAQALANVLHIVENDPEALRVPVGYAMTSNAKAGGGIIGALGGALEPLAQTQLTPHQQMVMRFRDQFIEAYMALITGKRGAGSPSLLQLARNAFFPLANQDDPEVQRSALASMRFALTKLTALAGGRAADLGGLPGYAEATREGLGLAPEGAPPATPDIPGAVGQKPFGFSDFLTPKP